MKKTYLFLMIMTGVLFLSSCTKEIIEDSRVKVITGDIQYPSTELTECTATIEAKSDNIVLQRGICYGSRPMPCLENAGQLSHHEGYTYVTYNGEGAGAFTTVLKDIPAHSTIHYRAFAKTKKGVVYGEDKEYSFGNNPSGSITWITCTRPQPTQATVSCTYGRDNSWQTVYSDQRGFIYSDDPEFNSFERVVVGWDYVYGNTTFNGTLTELDPNKVYYIKAFILYGGMTLYSYTKELH